MDIIIITLLIVNFIATFSVYYKLDKEDDDNKSDGEYDICNDIGKIRANLLEERPKNCPLVEIITCKNCKHRHIDEDLHGYHCERHHNVRFPVYNDFYCADGKRKEE